MDGIAQGHRPQPTDPPETHPGASALAAPWLAEGSGLVARISQAIAQRGAHAARTVVLLPYAQLMPLAARMWSAAMPHGFAPRFESTMNWAQGLGAEPAGAGDIAFDAAIDVLKAQDLLERAGLGAADRDNGGALASRLVEAAQQIARQAAAVLPALRPEWLARMRSGLFTAWGEADGSFALEQAVARISLDWAAASRHATDLLFEPWVRDGLDCLVVVEGFQAEPMPTALMAAFGDKAVALPWECAASDGAASQDAIPAASVSAPQGQVSIHQARDAEDEAQRAAACVLRHLQAGRSPVALAAIDRALTRRIGAMLAAHGVAMRDENGWKLSTTRAAAQAMSALRACAWDASTDAVLDWLKNAPAFKPAKVDAFERWLRREGLRQWRDIAALSSLADPRANDVFLAAAELREGMQRSRTLAQWLAALRGLLSASGQWSGLATDAAGQQLQRVLRLGEAQEAELAQELAGTVFAARKLGLAEFAAWVNDALEAESFVPAHPPREQVVVLPFSQMLGRPFAAAVLPGCDEVRLPAAPEPPGPWTAAQRNVLGLPSREQLHAVLRAAWRDALRRPHVDILWRSGDDGGEPLLASPLVLALELELEMDGHAAEDPREHRSIPLQPTQRPAAIGKLLPVERLSASGYQDLRHCPYKFFALRQLGLAESEELESEVDKRDFGLWLHAVLRAFHEALHAAPTGDPALRSAMLEEAAAQATREMRLDDGEFLPFAAAWPRVRDGYLAWLAAHEQAGPRFLHAEKWHELRLGPVTLVGKVDRIDAIDGDGAVLVIDYKTEGQDATRKRIAQPFEDTQLAFYAALLDHDTLRASYVNIGERDATRAFEQKEVVAVRDALVEGILHDLSRIADGSAMAALGAGSTCEYCGARGLCRRDFWTDEDAGAPADAGGSE